MTLLIVELVNGSKCILEKNKVEVKDNNWIVEKQKGTI